MAYRHICIGYNVQILRTLGGFFSLCSADNAWVLTNFPLHRKWGERMVLELHFEVLPPLFIILCFPLPHIHLSSLFLSFPVDSREWMHSQGGKRIQTKIQLPIE